MTEETKTPPVHVRTIRVEIARAGEHELEIAATLVDERPSDNPRWFGAEPPRVIHDMRLGLRVRHPDLVITEARSEMASHPYTICPDALPPLQQLVGLSISRGFTRDVNERFGRQRGCAHFTALIHAVAPAVRQGAGVGFPDQERSAVGEPFGDVRMFLELVPLEIASVVRAHWWSPPARGPARPAGGDPAARASPGQHLLGGFVSQKTVRLLELLKLAVGRRCAGAKLPSTRSRQPPSGASVGRLAPHIHRTPRVQGFRPGTCPGLVAESLKEFGFNSTLSLR